MASEATPLIEDCRDLFYNRIGEDHYGTYGNYSVFDFSRWFPMQFGAVLVGEYFSDQRVWNQFHCLDITKRNIVRELLQIHWLKQSDYLSKREKNQRKLGELFALLGMNYSERDNTRTHFGFLLNSRDPYSVRSIQERLSQFGIQTEIDEQEGVVVLPIHAALREGQLNYIFGAFRGMINPCHTFVRKDPAKE